MAVQAPTGVPTWSVVPDGLGWLLALRARERLGAVTHVRSTGYVAGPRGAWDTATRARVAHAMVEGTRAIVHGRPVVEAVAERRWLAWFPRPVGPRHAVNLGGPTVDVLGPSPGLEVVRAHLAMTTWRAELLQAAAPVARTDPGRRLVGDWVAGGERVADEDVRWACVLEATEHDHLLVRAWAYGWAPGATSLALAERVGRLDAGGLAGRDGTWARAVLDDLAAHAGARWSITGPQAPMRCR